MPTPRYLIRFKNHDGVKYAEFAGRGRRALTPGGLRGGSYRKRLRTPGSFTWYIQGDDDRLPGILLDFQCEVWRTDPFISAAHIATLPAWQRDPLLPYWYKDFDGLVRVPPEWTQGQDGSYTAVIRGRGYNDWLQAEPIMYPKGSAQALKTGVSETVIKAYVNENIGPGAGLDAAGNSRVRPGLSIEADGITGAVWPAVGESGDRAEKPLIDVTKEIAQHAPADYMIIGVGDALFQFMWRYPYWGLDRTVGNVSGNTPILFSSRQGNLTNIHSWGNYLDDINVVNVIGQGNGILQKVVAVTGGNLALSPWARRATVETLRDVVSTGDLTAYGGGILEELQAKTMVEGDYLQTQGIRYGPDTTGTQAYWDFGDIISVESDRTDTVISKRVVGVTVRLSSSGSDLVESIVPELEEPYAV